MKWIYRLDYKYGNRYIRRLMTIILAGMVMVLLADTMLPVDMYGLLSLNRAAILNNFQFWRLITFVFVPPGSLASPFWLLIALYFYYSMGTALENTWGGFRFNLYYLLGILGAWAAMFISGFATNGYLNLSLFLAFATIAPDTQFRLFFILPIKAKWLAIAYGVLVALSVIGGFLTSPAYGFSNLITLAFSLLNYLIFFGRGLWETISVEITTWNNRRKWRNQNR